MTTLQLSGNSGNIFVILARADKCFKENGVPKADIKKMLEEVGKSGDYHRALEIIMDYADKHGIEVE